MANLAHYHNAQMEALNIHESGMRPRWPEESLAKFLD